MEDGRHGRRHHAGKGYLSRFQQFQHCPAHERQRQSVFLATDDGTAGHLFLWQSDGTPEGTTIAKTSSGSPIQYPSALWNVNGVLFFGTLDGLWKSDGTAAGTVLVSSTHPYLAAASSQSGLFFYLASDETHGTELWRCDGTPAVRSC